MPVVDIATYPVAGGRPRRDFDPRVRSIVLRQPALSCGLDGPGPARLSRTLLSSCSLATAKVIMLGDSNVGKVRPLATPPRGCPLVAAPG